MYRQFLVQLVALVLLLFVSNAYALDTPIMMGGTNLPSTTATNYTHAVGNALNWNATEASSRTVMPISGTVKNFYARVGTAPASGKSWVFTIVRNGTDTAISCTVSNTGTTCNDTSDTQAFSAGDTISIKAAPSGTPTSPTSIQFGYVVSSSNAGESPILGSTRSTNLSNTTTQYATLQGGTAPSATLNLRDAPAPVSGTFGNLYVELSGTPGVGTGYTFTLLKNGSSTAIACSITDSATTCNDTVDTVSVVSGDTVALQFSVQSGTPTARLARWGIRWQPSTAGETIFLHNDATSPNVAGAVRYSYPAGGSQAWNTAENTSQALSPGVFTAKTWIIQLNNAPGGTTPQFTFRSRLNAAFGNLSVTIAGASTSGSDISNSDSLVAGDVIGSYSISANSPASAVSKWGLVVVDPNDTPTPTPTPSATNTPTPTPTPPVVIQLLASTGVGQ